MTQETLLNDILTRVGEIQQFLLDAQDLFLVLGAVIVGLLTLIWISRW